MQGWGEEKDWRVYSLHCFRHAVKVKMKNKKEKKRNEEIEGKGEIAKCHLNIGNRVFPL